VNWLSITRPGEQLCQQRLTHPQCLNLFVLIKVQCSEDLLQYSMSKTKTPTAPQLSLSEELRALDLKKRRFRNDLPPELQKKFSPYLMMRYAASVEGSADLQNYCLIACNEQVNRNFFDLSKHPDLQWLSCTTVSPGLGSMRHYWLGSQSKSDVQKKQDRLRKQLLELCPTWKHQEIDLWLKLNTPEDVTAWIQAHGIELDQKP
jgi:ribosome-binding factor A